VIDLEVGVHRDRLAIADVAVSRRNGDPFFDNGAIGALARSTWRE
jgi:hypothetical protein